MVKFGEWAPDAADLDSTLARVAENVLPGANSYVPMPSLSQYANVPLAANAVGLTMARQTAGGWQIWAGTATKLYKFATSSWTDVTRLVGGNYGVPANEIWRFAQFGANLVAVNGVDNPQSINVDSGTNFALLAGSPPVARNVSIVGDFLVLSSLVSLPYRVQWSAINDITGWTVGTSLSDIQDFADGGKVTGVAGGEIGYVLQEYAIRRMTFVPGSDYVFTFVRVEDGKGCISPYGYASVAGTVYFVAEDGFYAFSEAGINPIGAQRVNEWFLDNSDTTRIDKVLCVADPYHPRILWAYYSTTSSAQYDRIIAFDWQLNKWTYGKVDAQIWGAAAAPGTTLDSLSGSIDALPYSLDSRAYEGGRPTLSVINTSKNLAFFEGPPLQAVIETQEFQANPGGRAFITEVEPLVDTSNATVRIGARERYADSASYSSSSSMEVTGRCSVRSSGRMHRVEVTIPAGEPWTHAIGLSFKAKPDGVR